MKLRIVAKDLFNFPRLATSRLTRSPCGRRCVQTYWSWSGKGVVLDPLDQLEISAIWRPQNATFLRNGERVANAFWMHFERLLNGYGLVRVRLRVWTAPNVDFFTPLYGLTRVNFGFERVHTGSYGFQRRSKPLNVKFPQKLFRVVDFRCLTLLMSDLSLPPQYSGPNGLDKTHNLYIWSVLVKSKTLPILFWGDSEPLKFEWENCPPFVGELPWRITPQVNDQRLQVGRWPIHLVVPRHVLKDLWAVRSGFNLRLTTASRLEHRHELDSLQPKANGVYPWWSKPVCVGNSGWLWPWDELEKLASTYAPNSTNNPMNIYHIAIG